MVAAEFSTLGRQAQASAFWNKDMETMPRERLDALHLHRLQSLVRYAYEFSPFYHKRFDEIGLKPRDIRTIEDFKRKVPLTDKSEFVHLQRERPPYGPTLALPPEFVAHHAETSGTTGVPLAIPYSMYDTIRYGESWAYGFWALGIRPDRQLLFRLQLGEFRRFLERLLGRAPSRRPGDLRRRPRHQGPYPGDPAPAADCAHLHPDLRAAHSGGRRRDGRRSESLLVKYTYHAGEPGPTALPAMRAEIERAWDAKAGELTGNRGS